jgi:hypothetical protein
VLELRTDDYLVWYNPETHTVTCQGSLRLASVADYAPIIDLLEKAARCAPGQLILDLQALEFLNRSAAHVLSQFVRAMQQTKGLDLLVRGARALPDLLDYIEQIRSVTGAAAAVVDGTFDPQSLDAVAARPDELGQLARVFQHMAREVAVREQQLHNEVCLLRVEVDLARQARDVAAITETDAFRALQERARQMRARKGDDNQHP